MRYFGTDGIRGRAYETLTESLAIKVGKSLSLIENKKVIIGYDTRQSNHMLADAISLGARSVNKDVFDIGVIPTPGLAFCSLKEKCIGIMITASHNPKEHNGFKVYDENGCQLVPSKIEPLLKIIDSMPTEIECVVPPYKKHGEFVILDHQIDHEYLNLIRNIQINPNLSKKNFKIVYSPQHGTSFVNAIRIFKKCGYEVYPVLSQCAPDPNFSGTLTPNPEDPRSYNEAIEALILKEFPTAKVIHKKDMQGKNRMTFAIVGDFSE